MKKYFVFKRTANNFETFARARKYFIRGGLTYQEAQELCTSMNARLTPAQERNGTKYEFTGEEYR